MAETILVAVDGSEQSFQAVDLAARLTTDSETELELLHVVPDRDLPKGLEQWAKIEHVTESSAVLYERSVAEGLLQSARGRLGDRPHVRTRVEHGDPATKIIEVAEQDDVSTIIMGTRGLSRLKGMIMGSTAQKVALGTRRPVISINT